MNNSPYCKCNVPCIWKTSRKAKSLGRTFGCCSRENGDCGFFIWSRSKIEPKTKDTIKNHTIDFKWLELDKEIRSKIKN